MFTTVAECFPITANLPAAAVTVVTAVVAVAVAAAYTSFLFKALMHSCPLAVAPIALLATLVTTIAQFRLSMANTEQHYTT